MEGQQSFVALAEAALELVEDGSIVGLGSGHTMAAVIELLGRRVRDGLRIRGVPTSLATAHSATQLGIPLVSLDDIEAIDVTVDGADEVAPNLDLIKGLGGALVREKIVGLGLAPAGHRRRRRRNSCPRWGSTACCRWKSCRLDWRAAAAA